MKILLFVLVLGVIFPSQKPIQDKQGRILGWSRKEKEGVKFFDKHGRLKGSTQKQGGKYKIKDAYGRPQGFSELDGMFNGFIK